MAASAKVENNFPWDDPMQIDITRARLNSRCQDLLSVHVPTQSTRETATLMKSESYRLCRIEFLHRSVQEFLKQSEGVSEKLERLVGPGFNVDRTLLACYVFLTKKAGQTFHKMSIYWSTQALLHLASVGDEYDAPASRLLQDLDESK
jgi:hypothetical protein